jgi:riboflavin kinase
VQEIHILPRDSSAAPASAAETHSGFHAFPDFYGTALKLLILGYIRPEYDYVSLEALVDDIRVDCEVARASLARKPYAVYLSDCGDDQDDEKKVEDDGEKARADKEWLTEF